MGGLIMPYNPSIAFDMAGNDVREYNQKQALRDAGYANQMGDFAETALFRPLQNQVKMGALRNTLELQPAEHQNRMEQVQFENAFNPIRHKNAMELQPVEHGNRMGQALFERDFQPVKFQDLQERTQDSIANRPAERAIRSGQNELQVSEIERAKRYKPQEDIVGAMGDKQAEKLYDFENGDQFEPQAVGLKTINRNGDIVSFETVDGKQGNVDLSSPAWRARRSKIHQQRMAEGRTEGGRALKLEAQKERETKQVSQSYERSLKRYNLAKAKYDLYKDTVVDKATGKLMPEAVAMNKDLVDALASMEAEYKHMELLKKRQPATPAK
jgi:hypothetical protein